jgi:hypothetical protein
MKMGCAVKNVGPAHHVDLAHPTFWYPKKVKFQKKMLTWHGEPRHHADVSDIATSPS